MTAGFLSPVHPNITGRNAATVPVPPAMSRNSATDAAHAKIFPARKIAAMLTRELTITKSVRIKIRGIFTERITTKKNCFTRFMAECAVLFSWSLCFNIRSKPFSLKCKSKCLILSLGIPLAKHNLTVPGFPGMRQQAAAQLYENSDFHCIENMLHIHGLR